MGVCACACACMCACVHACVWGGAFFLWLFSPTGPLGAYVGSKQPLKLPYLHNLVSSSVHKVLLFELLSVSSPSPLSVVNMATENKYLLFHAVSCTVYLPYFAAIVSYSSQ